ncbi:hypothetical protein [Streptosporangium sp. NPDC023615]|uniref:hypothetical protein n=1 Tax=Streptosporangium sp. NPDC023615 TaxID=3154794 RepID=UPI003428E809
MFSPDVRFLVRVTGVNASQAVRGIHPGWADAGQSMIAGALFARRCERVPDERIIRHGPGEHADAWIESLRVVCGLCRGPGLAGRLCEAVALPWKSGMARRPKDDFSWSAGRRARSVMAVRRMDNRRDSS